MSIPSALMHAVESHPCFAGQYRFDANVDCLLPSGTFAKGFCLECVDCFRFHLVCLLDQLDPGARGPDVADSLSAHVRAVRGYSLSFGGYHTEGGGFWLSAAYWPGAGVFVLDGSRGSNHAPPLDLLVLAFSSGVAHPPDANMTDPRLYQTHDVYLSVVPPPAVSTLSALLASPAVSVTPKPGFSKVTLAEYLPVSTRAHASCSPPAPVAASSSAVDAPATGGEPRRLGDRCSRCGAEVKERPLLTSTYIGCLCG